MTQLSVDNIEYINWFLQMVEYYSAIKKKKKHQQQTDTWKAEVKFKNKLIKRSQTQRTKGIVPICTKL